MTTQQENVSLPNSEELEKRRRILDEISNCEFNVDIYKRTVEEYDGNIETQLNHAREYLSKLKFNFTELETKQSFIESVMKFDPNNIQEIDSEKENAELSTATSQAKALKEQNTQLTAQLTRLGEAAVARQSSLQLTQSALSTALTQLTAASARHRVLYSKVEAQSVALASSGSLDVEEADRAVMEKEAELAALKAEVEAERTRAAKAKASLSTCEEQKRQFLEQKAQLSEQLASLQGSRADEDACLGREAQWLSRMTTLLGKLSGIRLQHNDKGLFMFEGTSMKGQTFGISLEFDCESNRLLSAKVDRQTPEIKAVVDQAVATNDPAYLIQKVKCIL